MNEIQTITYSNHFEFNGATTSFKDTDKTIEDTDKTIEPIKEKIISPFGKGNWKNVRDLTDEHQEDTPF